MSIVSHTLDSFSQSGSRQYVTYKFTDHLSGETFIEKYVSLSFNTNADMLSMYSTIESQLSSIEEQEIIYRLEKGEDVLAQIQAPKHATDKILAKTVIYHIMRERDPYLVLAAESFILFLQANYTATQLATFLDITVAQVATVNTRVNEIINNKTVFETADNNREELS